MGSLRTTITTGNLTNKEKSLQRLQTFIDHMQYILVTDTLISCNFLNCCFSKQHLKANAVYFFSIPLLLPLSNPGCKAVFTSFIQLFLPKTNRTVLVSDKSSLILQNSLVSLKYTFYNKI